MSEMIDGVEQDGGIDTSELITFEKGVEVSSGYGYTIDGDNAIRFPVDNTNIAVGPSAANALETGATSNMAIGNNAMLYNEDGDYNVAIGVEAGYGASGQSYSNNVFVGFRAGYGNSIGAQNTFMGTQAGDGNTEGNSSVLLGHQAGFYNETGDNNVAIGSGAGFGASGQNHSNNVFVGYQAGYSMTTGDGNIFIGYQAGYNETGSDKLYIDNSNTADPLIYGEFDNNLVKINGTLTTTGDNSSADTAYVPMVLFNTDDTPPAASGFPLGTIYIQYTP